LTTEAPTGTVQPPVKLVIAKTVAKEIVTVFEVVVQVNPVAQATVKDGPVCELMNVIPAGVE
jgi:hypothetical protein